MTSIVIDTASFSPDQVKQILEFVEGLKTPVINELTSFNSAQVRAHHENKNNLVAKCVGRDGNLEPEIAAKLFGADPLKSLDVETFRKDFEDFERSAEPSVGNEPMKETRFTDYKPDQP